MLEPFQLPFVQRGLAEILILAIPAGLLGTWIVLRGLAFFSHGVGTAAFPGLVLADGLGFAAPLGAFGAALAFTVGATGLRGRRSGPDAAVALVLVACLAGGVILASDVFASGANVETLLFGSLLLVDRADLALAAAVAVATLAATALLGRHWLRQGFDPALAGSGGPDPRLCDAVLLGLVALAATAALTVVGALLVTALFLVPALTARLLTSRLRSWQLLSVGLVAVQGSAGLWISVKTNAPPGATIAVVAGATFALVALWRALAGARRAGLAAAALGGLVLFGAGCGGAGMEGGAEKARVVATTTVVADLVDEVGGDAIELERILQPNTDPHDYEPRPGDVQAVADADLVLASGADLDGWIDEVVAESGSTAEVVDLSEQLRVRLAGEHGHDEDDDSELDPHWWHDPRNAIAATRRIELGLISADPARSSDFRRSAARYISRLGSLDEAIAECVEAIPPARRKLVTDHDAFGYFANRYGLEVVGAAIPSQSSQAQPSARDLRELAAMIEAEEVPAIFPGSSLNPRVAETIARQTGASAEHTLYGDSLGPAGSDAPTYLRMLEANADSVVRGLTEGRNGCRPNT